MRGKQEGSMLDFLSVCICILAMSIVVTAYFYCSDLLLRKGQVSQVARCYILRMETVGCLTEGDKNQMLAELQTIGLQGIDLTGRPIGIICRINNVPDIHVSAKGRGYFKIQL